MPDANRKPCGRKRNQIAGGRRAPRPDHPLLARPALDSRHRYPRPQRTARTRDRTLCGQHHATQLFVRDLPWRGPASATAITIAAAPTGDADSYAQSGASRYANYPDHRLPPGCLTVGLPSVCRDGTGPNRVTPGQLPAGGIRDAVPSYHSGNARLALRRLRALLFRDAHPLRRFSHQSLALFAGKTLAARLAGIVRDLLALAHRPQ